MYLDDTFRDRVLRKVHNDPYHRVAPSYAFDLVPIVRNAWYARILETTLHAAIVASVLAPAFTGHTLTAGVVACGLLLSWLAWREIRLLSTVSREYTRYAEAQRRKNDNKLTRLELARMKRGRSDTPLREIGERLQLIALVSVPIAVAGLWIGLAQPAETLLAARLLLVLAAIALVVGGISQYHINRFHRPSRLRPTRLTPREKAIDTQQSHPCTVYRRTSKADEDEESPFLSLYGTESPFVGSGEIVHHWDPPMTVRILRDGDEDTARREYSTPPFTAHELVDHLESAVKKLDEDDDNIRLDLAVHRRIYVSETVASTDRRLVQARPTPEEVARIIDDPRGRKHHFLEVSAPTEDGEVVTVVLLRVIVQGRMLSIDFAGCALAQTPQEYQRVETYGEHGMLAVIATAVRTLVNLPAEFRKLWRLAELPLMLILALWAQRDRTLVPRRGVLIGTRFSVREEKAQEWSKVQLDKTTILKNMKIIEKRLLNAAEDFLRAKRVDTSEFDKQATKIFNSGIMNLGNNNQVSGNVLGSGTQVIANIAGQQGGAGNQQGGGRDA